MAARPGAGSRTDRSETPSVSAGAGDAEEISGRHRSSTSFGTRGGVRYLFAAVPGCLTASCSTARLAGFGDPVPSHPVTAPGGTAVGTEFVAAWVVGTTQIAIELQ